MNTRRVDRPTLGRSRRLPTTSLLAPHLSTTDSRTVDVILACTLTLTAVLVLVLSAPLVLLAIALPLLEPLVVHALHVDARP